MGFFSVKTSSASRSLPGMSAFVSQGADGSQQYNGSAHTAAVHRAQQFERQAAKDAARQAAIKNASNSDKLVQEKSPAIGRKVADRPADGLNIIEFPRHTSPMFLGVVTGNPGEDKHKFVSLGLSVDRFRAVLREMDQAETLWVQNSVLSKSEKRKINWQKYACDAVELEAKSQNRLLAKDNIFVRFGYAYDPTIEEYGPVVMFPENQTQYDSWKKDMFR